MLSCSWCGCCPTSNQQLVRSLENGCALVCILFRLVYRHVSAQSSNNKTGSRTSTLDIVRTDFFCERNTLPFVPSSFVATQPRVLLKLSGYLSIVKFRPNQKRAYDGERYLSCRLFLLLYSTAHHFLTVT